MAQRWVQKYLSDAQIKDISEAVHQAELGTQGEIVPMIVHRSSAIRHVPVVMALSLVVAFLGIELLGLNGWYLRDLMPFMMEHWAYQLGILLLLILAGWGLSFWHPVQRLLTADGDEKDQVERRAQLEFFLHRLHHTHKKTAVLVFVSIMERRAVILADEGIAKVLPPETWEQSLKSLTSCLHRGEWAQGLTEAIHQGGDLLKKHFPEASGATGANEISNQLIIKE